MKHTFNWIEYTVCIILVSVSNSMEVKKKGDRLSK